MLRVQDYFLENSILDRKKILKMEDFVIKITSVSKRAVKIIVTIW